MQKNLRFAYIVPLKIVTTTEEMVELKEWIWNSAPKYKMHPQMHI